MRAREQMQSYRAKAAHAWIWAKAPVAGIRRPVCKRPCPERFVPPSFHEIGRTPADSDAGGCGEAVSGRLQRAGSVRVTVDGSGCWSIHVELNGVRIAPPSANLRRTGLMRPGHRVGAVAGVNQNAVHARSFVDRHMRLAGFRRVTVAPRAGWLLGAAKKGRTLDDRERGPSNRATPAPADHFASPQRRPAGKRRARRSDRQFCRPPAPGRSRAGA